MTGQSPDDARAEEDLTVVMPPVRLLPEKELARLALESPILGTALRLARWIAPGVPVTTDGVLDLESARRAVRELRLLPEDECEPVLGAMGSADELGELDLPWAVAEELGLIDIHDESAEPGCTLDLVGNGRPDEILELWWEAAEVVVAEACLPAGDDLFAAATGAGRGEGSDDLEMELAVDAELLYNALENLYLISVLEQDLAAASPPMAPDGPGAPPAGATRTGPGAGTGTGPGTGTGTADEPKPVPLPVVAASMVVPEDMDAPTDEALEEVSELMMQLDGALRLVAGTGLVDYRPVDPGLLGDDEGGDEHPGGNGDTRIGEGAAGDGDAGARTGQGAAAAHDADEDVSRYGMVTLTPLGAYGVRRHLVAMGVEAPAVGDLVDADAGELLGSIGHYPDDAAGLELQGWLAHREQSAAARELLAAARGDDPGAPLRRLYCQQALALLGPPADTALREVLDDRHLGGLARVRLVERGADGVPAASEEMVFWLTVDTLAAQLSADADADALQELVRGIPLTHGADSFFAAAWQVDHPATADALEALGRLHPDRNVAKEARKAAFKARSRTGTGT